MTKTEKETLVKRFDYWKKCAEVIVNCSDYSLNRSERDKLSGFAAGLDAASRDIYAFPESPELTQPNQDSK